MAEENQVQQVTKEQQPVTTKDPKKVEVGKRLAAINRKKREVKKVKSEGVSQYYGIGAGFTHVFSAILAVGVIGGLGYYIYQFKKGEPTTRRGASTSGEVPNNPPNQPSPLVCQTNKFEMN